MTITGKTKLLGLIGDPVSHSLSPILHNHWFEKYDIDAVYVPLPIKAEDVESSLPALVNAGFIGFNVTVPHKQACARMPFINTDDFATRLKAVNTIKVEKSGDLTGYNTDGYGFLLGLDEKREASFTDGIIVLIGAGGASFPIALIMQSFNPREIRLLNRTCAKAEILDKTLNLNAKIFDWRDKEAALNGATLIVNTTTLGMDGHSPLVLPLHVASPKAIVYDIIYNPSKTALLEQAEEYGLQTINGLRMLIYQAQEAFEHWFGILPEVTAETIALLEGYIPR